MKIFQNIKNINSNNIINSSNVTMSNCNGKNRVTINGRSYDVPSGNVSIINKTIYVNGKKFNPDNSYDIRESKIINVVVEGNIEIVDCSGNVEVKGNVGKIDCSGNVCIKGDVNADIDCGGNCTIEGNHKGSIDASGSVMIN